VLGLDNFVYQLLQSGADPNAIDVCEHTSLGLAAQAGHFNVVEVLLQKGSFKMREIQILNFSVFYIK